jgi:hypothetical protein
MKKLKDEDKLKKAFDDGQWRKIESEVKKMIK